MEKYKYIRGTSFKYAVNRQGAIYSFMRERFVGAKKPNNLGYMKVYLKGIQSRYSSSSSMFSIHRVVAEAWLPNPLKLREINHIDGNKANNAASNLEWCTHSHNILHSFRTLGRIPATGHMKGKIHSEATKQAMSEAKIGVNHPKFKGWYVIDGVKYTSTQEIETKTGMCGRTAVRRCHAKVKGYRFKPK